MFETARFVDLLQFSSSETVRIGFPIAGVMQLRQAPLLGVGGGNTRFFMKDYIYKLMPWAKQMPEVVQYVEEQSSAATPRNLYARIIGETGILGFFLFVYLVSEVARAIRPVWKGENTRVKCFFQRLTITILVINLQFDSFALQQNWVFLAIVTAWLVRRNNETDFVRVWNAA
ncbi:MAG: hypothetical protein HN368_24610 [Spirochaetales bacterium]|nr:hypothetical protein [Spirochaetales bacterium]